MANYESEFDEMYFSFGLFWPADLEESDEGVRTIETIIAISSYLNFIKILNLN